MLEGAEKIKGQKMNVSLFNKQIRMNHLTLVSRRQNPLKLLHSIMILNTTSLPYKAGPKNTHTTHTHTHWSPLMKKGKTLMQRFSWIVNLTLIRIHLYTMLQILYKIVSQALLVSCNPMFYTSKSNS
jgi:hypothetical protein